MKPLPNNKPNHQQFCNRTRREFLWQSGTGFGATALAGLLGPSFFAKQAQAADGLSAYTNPMAPRLSHFAPKAKSVIFLFMYGGPSQVDTFDYKPKMYPLDGKTIDVKTFGRGGKKNTGRVVGPKYNFKPYGQSGKMISDLFPNLGTCADDMAFIHSMYADSPIHGSGLMMMNTGRIISGHPSLGSWITYGLGSENENLPGYVVMLDKTGGPINGAQNWNNGFMPASYQGTVFRSGSEPILILKPNAEVSQSTQRRLLNQLRDFNHQHEQRSGTNSDLAARIASFELAYKMQMHAPEAVDIAAEPKHIRELYGIDTNQTADFGRKCLLARRLVERGVRFIQIYSGGAHNDDNWDAHTDIVKNHSHHAGATDQPIAALLKDLKQRGLLDSTLVVWGGEFGRQPTAEYEKGTGRDHNSYGFTMWMAGGGIKPGTSVGATDELGNNAVEKPFHVKNLHATILTQLGLDPNHLAYFFGGLDQSLVGVEGAQPIHDLI